MEVVSGLAIMNNNAYQEGLTICNQSKELVERIALSIVNDQEKVKQITTESFSDFLKDCYYNGLPSTRETALYELVYAKALEEKSRLEVSQTKQVTDVPAQEESVPVIFEAAAQPEREQTNLHPTQTKPVHDQLEEQSRAEYDSETEAIPFENESMTHRQQTLNDSFSSLNEYEGFQTDNVDAEVPFFSASFNPEDYRQEDEFFSTPVFPNAEENADEMGYFTSDTEDNASTLSEYAQSLIQEDAVSENPELDAGGYDYALEEEENEGFADPDTDEVFQNTDDIPNKKTKTKKIILTIVFVILILLILWLLIGLLINTGHFPKIDLGYSWFNDHVFRAFFLTEL